MSPTYDVIDFNSWMILMLSSLTFYTTTLCIMPDFRPNDQMLTRGRHLMQEFYGDQKCGYQDWEVYAWCLRDAMSKASGLGTTEFALSDKVQYEQFMLGNRDSCRAGQKTYKYVRGQILEETEDNYKIETKTEQVRTPLLAA